MINNNFDDARADFIAACEKHGLTADAVSSPKAETRSENWDCVSWEVSYKANGREFQRSKFSQGLGHFKTDKMTLSLLSYLGSGVENMKYNTLKRPLEAKGVPEMYELLAKKRGCDTVSALACLVSDSSVSLNRSSFEDFCDDYGYDEDSIRAKEVYDAIRETGDALIRAIGEDATRELYDISCEF